MIRIESSPLFEARTMLMSAIGMLELASQSSDPKVRAEYNQIALLTLRSLQKMVDGKSASEEPQDLPAMPRYARKILLAEDNEINRRVVTKFLSTKGYSVTAVENGERALGEYNAGSFDLVLLDVMMPEIDGIEVAKRIKELEVKDGRKTVPVIALTALEESQHPELQSVFDGVIMKPFSSASLLGVIARLGSEK